MTSRFNMCVTVAIVFSSCSSSLDEGLVVHTTFDRDGKDSGQNQWNSTLQGAVITRESMVGEGAVYMDGADDYVSFPPGQVYFSGNYSLSVWCKVQSGKTWSRILDFNQEEPASGNAVTWLIGRPGKTQNNMWFDQWVMYEEIAVESILDIRHLNPADAYLNYDVQLNEWTHFVITYDAAVENPLGLQQNRNGYQVPLEGQVTLYVNGEKVSASSYCLKPQNVATTSNWLGRSRFAADPYYKGFMDDFRIYNRVLSEKEITALYSLNKE